MEPTPDLVHDAQLLRHAASLVVADCRKLLRWQSTATATAMVERWISADLRRRAALAAERARQLREVAARLRCEAAEQQKRYLRASDAANRYQG